MDLRRGKRIRCVVAVDYEEKEWDWYGGDVGRVVVGDLGGVGIWICGVWLEHGRG